MLDQLANILAQPLQVERQISFEWCDRKGNDAFEALTNGFWFKAIVAVQKVVRGDLLVALHLSLELAQECCVLAMMLAFPPVYGGRFFRHEFFFVGRTVRWEVLILQVGILAVLTIGVLIWQHPD